MLVLISPSKTMDFSKNVEWKYTVPGFIDYSEELIGELKKMSVEQLQNLMKLSTKLAELNHDRYEQFSTPFTLENAAQAIYAFKGDVYDGLDVESLSRDDLAYAQKHLRILSGLYGLLRPLDLIQPYRLEMGTKMKSKYGEDLYQFWGEKVTKKVDEVLAKQGDNILIDLASNEYFKAIKTKLLHARIITPTFKDYKNGQYKMLMVYVKRARGTMSNYIIKNRVTDLQTLKDAKIDGYKYNAELSDGDNWVYTRGE